MRQAPQLVNMADLVSSLIHTSTGLVRPTSNAGIISRIKLAWLVFIGDCDALNWGGYTKRSRQMRMRRRNDASDD